MRQRQLGRTGLMVSECTLGTMMLAREGGEAAEYALERGVNAVEIDAGDRGAIEALAGLVAGREVHVLARIASQVRFDLPSPHVPAGQAWPGGQVRAQAEALLKALGVERLGLLQFHAWCPEWLHEGDWLETCGRLREEGKIAGIGISLFDHDVDAGVEAIASGRIDCVQAMLNLFDQGAAPLFALGARHGVAGIARSPLYYGMLAGAKGFADGDWRHDYFYDAHLAEAAERVSRLAPLPELALRYALSDPAVATVAVGMRTHAQVEQNLTALEKGPLDAETVRQLAAHKWLC